MHLSAGDRLGPYEILAPIGAGGMGEVYRARDTKLDRDVAIKVLPAALAQDPERLARFEREAKVLAALNHPNIAQIYGLEQRALVMELVEGETLKGPLPLETALNYAKQIADALEAAHEKGITHRDLKPANIMITPAGVVKVLDFGLAAVAQDPASGSTDPENSPTLTMRATQTGMIMGTAAYMSPEQAAGKPVDKRADIWSFGVVLFELLTGRQLFGEGETISHTLADVLRAPIDFDKLPKEPPRAIRDLLRRCLDRDVKNRLRDIGEARVAIANAGREPEVASGAVPVPTHRTLPWAVGVAVMALIAGTTSWVAWRATRPVEQPLIRLSVDLGPDTLTSLGVTAAISPDGRRLVFPVRSAAGSRLLATRLLDQPTATPLPGTEGGRDPFFSPDGQWIGFFAGSKLKKISVLGGASLALCDATNGRGASWGEDGNIVAALSPTAGTGLSRVSAAGGPPQTLTKPLQGERDHRWPKVLPGGHGVLFSASLGGNADEANIEVLSLETGQTKTLLRGGYSPSYLPTSGRAGHLVYLHQGVLFGVPFDPVRLELRGTPAPLLDDVAGDPSTGGGQLDVSQNGTLIYLSGKSSNATYPVVWLEGSGKTQPLLTRPGVYYTPRFSPDGNFLALSVNAGKDPDIYVYDWQHDTMPRLTFSGQGNVLPVWTPDGKHITYTASNGLWWVRADGAGEPQRLLESKNPVFGNSFSPDGKRFSYAETSPETRGDIWTVSLDLSDPEHPKAGKPEPFLRTPANEIFGIFSPDGRWIAYSSDESGQPEVYVRPFPGPGGRWQVSTGGGFVPVWSRDGRQLLYVTSGIRIMVTEYVAKGESFSYAKPRLWSDKQILPTGNRYLDLHPDGKRFAVFPQPDVNEEKQGSVHVTFLLNFFDEVRRRVPAGGK